MEEYRQWLEQQIERCLNDKDLQREHWAFCKAYEKFTALRQPLVSGQVCKHKHIMHINSEIGWLCLDCRKFSDDKQTFR